MMEYLALPRRARSDDPSGPSIHEGRFIALVVKHKLDEVLLPMSLDAGSHLFPKSVMLLSFVKVERLALVIRDVYRSFANSKNEKVLREAIFDGFKRYSLALESKRRLHSKLEKTLTKSLPGLDTLCEELYKNIGYEDVRKALLHIVIDDLKQIEHSGSVADKERLLRKINDGFLTLTPLGRKKMIVFLSGALEEYDYETVSEATANVFSKKLIYPLTAQIIVEEVKALSGEREIVVEQFRHSVLTGIIKDLHEMRDRIHERSRRLELASEMLCQEPAR